MRVLKQACVPISGVAIGIIIVNSNSAIIRIMESNEEMNVTNSVSIEDVDVVTCTEPVEIPSVDEEEDVFCRFCFDSTQTEGNALIEPCLCSGSSAVVHELCLRRYIKYFNVLNCIVTQISYVSLVLFHFLSKQRTITINMFMH